jgi:hypothetical protein
VHGCRWQGAPPATDTAATTPRPARVGASSRFRHDHDDDDAHDDDHDHDDHDAHDHDDHDDARTTTTRTTTTRTTTTRAPRRRAPRRRARPRRAHHDDAHDHDENPRRYWHRGACQKKFSKSLDRRDGFQYLDPCRRERPAAERKP